LFVAIGDRRLGATGLASVFDRRVRLGRASLGNGTHRRGVLLARGIATAGQTRALCVRRQATPFMRITFVHDVNASARRRAPDHVHFSRSTRVVVIAAVVSVVLWMIRREIVNVRFGDWAPFPTQRQRVKVRPAVIVLRCRFNYGLRLHRWRRRRRHVRHGLWRRRCTCLKVTPA
jgi:hypothetical protein